jgi:hypothetical protein
MAVAERTFGDSALAGGRARLGLRWLALPLVETVVAGAVFAVALFVYNATLTPSLSYVSLDGNELATVPYQLGLAHPTGYPLYTWAGKLFTLALPFGDVAHRVNFLSAFGAAGGSAFLFAVTAIIIRGSAGQASSLREPAAPRWSTRVLGWLPLVAAGIGALMFAFAKTLWSQAVIAEVYAPNVFMVGLTFLLLLLWGRYERRRIALTAPGRGRAGIWAHHYSPDAKSLALFGAFALAFGLSLGTHMSNLALAPGFVAFILLTNWRLALQPRFIAAGVVGFGLGALQFLWLPYKAAHVNDAALARNTPNDLTGIYNYTLNAFPQLKWSVPWAQVPDRMVMYMDFMRDNFRLAGMLLAAAGGLAMAWRNPRAFFLLAPGYVFEVAFFVEYRASDIDVFFITAHFLTAVFIGYGVWTLAEGGVFVLRRLLARPVRAISAAAVAPEGSPASGSTMRAALRALAGRQSSRRIARWISIAVMGAVAGFILAQPVISLAGNWGEADQSQNTGINDFYENVFAMLPQNATLIGRGGVFGYDMFYWRYVYNVRPDVTIPLAERFDNTRVPAGSRTYTITPPGGQGGFGGPSPAPRGLQSSNSWYWPVISAPVETDSTAALALQRQLTLFEAHSQAPQMFVSGVTPQFRVGQNFGSVTLVGYDVDATSVQAGGTVHLKLYWQTNGNVTPQVSTKVGDTNYFEAHQLGFGNLLRYTQTYGQPSAGSLLVEDYNLVILSSAGHGKQPFSVRVSAGAFGFDEGGWLQIGTFDVH